MNEGVGWEKQKLLQSKKHQNNFTGTAYALLNLNRKLLQQANFLDTNTGEKEAVE